MSVPENLAPEFLDGENLLLAPASDEAAFIRQVVRAAGDAALRERLAAGALALSERYSWPVLARQVLDLPSYRAARA